MMNFILISEEAFVCQHKQLYLDSNHKRFPDRLDLRYTSKDALICRARWCAWIIGIVSDHKRLFFDACQTGGHTVETLLYASMDLNNSYQTMFLAFQI